MEHLTELKALASELGIAERVDFYCSVSNSERHQLTSNALAVLYTPDREHFGIVPC